MDLKRPVCYTCPNHFQVPLGPAQSRCGITLEPGARYCMAGRRPHRFKKRDPAFLVPRWCPKRKVPSELRIYTFKSQHDFFLHEQLSEDLGHAITPQARRYAVEYELHTDLTPRESWLRCGCESDAALLGVAVHRYHVVEIDDGLCPVCFYKTEHGYEIIHFDTQSVKNNRKEVIDNEAKQDV